LRWACELSDAQRPLAKMHCWMKAAQTMAFEMKSDQFQKNKQDSRVSKNDILSAVKAMLK